MCTHVAPVCLLQPLRACVAAANPPQPPSNCWGCPCRSPLILPPPTSAHPPLFLSDKELWLKVMAVATAVVIIPFTAFTVFKELTHEHHERVEYAHMHTFKKPFPWKESECAMFDVACRSGKGHEAHH